MTDLADELRIIAHDHIRDRKRLDMHDCLMLFRAAEIVDMVEATQAALIESQQQRIATNDRLLHLMRERMTKTLAPITATLIFTGYNTWKSPCP